MITRICIIISLLAVPTISIRPGLFRFKEKPISSKFENAATTISVTSGFINQYLDHLNGPALGNFTQKYLCSEHFTTNKKLAFLFVADEANFENGVLTDERNPLVVNAKQFGATMFSLEHRYYGSSKPFDTYNSMNLRYLNSFQALNDIVHFIKFANGEYRLDSDVKWVLWGVGYGGTLAAEVRKLFPKVVLGVIASSAPMTRKMDFWDYNARVEITIRNVNETCYTNIKQGFSDITTAMTTMEGRKNISDAFQLDTRLDVSNLTNNDIQQFYQQIMVPFQQIVQLNSEFGISIGSMCNVMANTTSSPMQNVYNVWQYLNNVVAGGNAKLFTSYPQIVALLGDQSPNSAYIEDRLWLWQSCTEFGFFYTTNTDEQSMFGPILPKSIYLNQCFDVFPDANFTTIGIHDIIEDYNNFYGSADKYTGTNVVFTIGELDPWAALGKESFGDYSVVVYEITDAAYAADMILPDSTNPSIVKAHQIITDNVNYWFTNPPNPVTYVNTTWVWTRPNVFMNRADRVSSGELFSKISDDVKPKKVYPKQKINKRMIMGRPHNGFRPAPESDMNLASIPPGYEQGTFRQKHDHFDNTNTQYFQQRFFKNSQWAQPGGPNFLMIGGEGPESGGWVLNENITYLKWAQKYGATVYLLEHRYYGESTLGNNQNFNGLTSLQMLYDLAAFIRSVNYNTGNTAPWITFGGSYSGALSAWMREVFPDLVVGAVASSAPVFAKTDFYEYAIVVENSIRSYSPDCVNRIKSAFDNMNQLILTTEGRKTLSDTFTLKPPFGDTVREVDRQYFFDSIFSNFQGAVQYSGDNAGPYAYGFGIPDMCKFMLNDTNTPLQNVAKFNEFTIASNNNGEFSGTDNRYEDLVDFLIHAQEYGPEAGASLLWTFQTCNEFGYFQSIDSGNSIFGSSAPVNMYIQLCQDVIATYYSRDYIDSLVDSTNFVYGSRFFYRGTNVVLPNGNVDPWHALGLYYPLDPSVVPYLINGTAHCADMYPARAQDAPGLQIVRDLIDANIAKWLNPTPGGTTTTSNPNMTTITGSTGPTQNPVEVSTKNVSRNSLIITVMILFIEFIM